ncbi:hypothetical protein [Variovorax sp. DXTD-1]|uniref:hypothetical protein n=1 Tax=Variovorax sp. DXTD-1 TaxID=2495592 RepID=UPI000F8777CB|nr:hypothetical protein [Variovorax sp. DXTD-1]RST46315.1 hypothetical protein EJI00_21545 [Variovorax sp. DXTD-1]
MMYEHQASTTGATAAKFLALLNAEGAKGYRYVSDLAYSTENNVTKSLLIKDAETTYTYELLEATPASEADFVQQANARGARGFQYIGIYAQGLLYRKNNSSGATYSYLTKPNQFPRTKTRDYFLAQANEQGADGYRYVQEYLFDSSGNTSALYEKSAPGAIYSYEVPAGTPTTGDAFLAELNAQGTKGFRLLEPYLFDASFSTGNHIYVKDASQSTTFSYLLRDYLLPSAEMLAQANEEGAKGNGLLFVVPIMIPGKNIYYTPANCSGPLCDVHAPFIN